MAAAGAGVDAELVGHEGPAQACGHPGRAVAVAGMDLGHQVQAVAGGLFDGHGPEGAVALLAA